MPKVTCNVVPDGTFLLNGQTYRNVVRMEPGGGWSISCERVEPGAPEEKAACTGLSCGIVATNLDGTVSIGDEKYQVTYGSDGDRVTATLKKVDS